MNSGGKVEFEKFNGKGSFSMWKIRVEDLLVQNFLDVALEDRPEGLTDREWSSLEKRACAAIRGCLADSALYSVLEEKTPKGLWSKLHSMYMGKNMCNKLMLKKQLYSLRMPEGGDVVLHVQRYDQVCNDLLTLGVKMEEEDKSLLLLCSLPSSFDPLVTTLLYGKETLLYDDIISVLRSNEQRGRMTGDGVPQEGLSVGERSRRGKEGSRQRGRSKSRKGKREFRCYKCNEVGHLKRNCPLWKKHQGEKSGSESVSTVADLRVEEDLLVVSDGHKKAEDSWILDSACSHHYTPHRSWFAAYTKTDEGSVTLGDNHPCKVAGYGTVRVRMFDGVVRTLTHVKHVPDLKKNLVSLGYLERSGFSFSCRSGSGVLNIMRGALVVMRGRRLENNLYKMEGSAECGKSETAAATDDQQDLYRMWHYRLGHMGERGMKELMKDGRIPDLDGGDSEVCEPCQMGKQHRVKFATSSMRSGGPLELVHSDVWGPAPVSGRNGARYFMSLIDDFSRRVWVFFLREKSEVFTKFKAWRAEVEKEKGRCVKVVRTDDGGEFTGEEFLEICGDGGIRRQISIERTFQQGGVAEQTNRTLMEKAGRMRLQVGLPKECWVDTVDTVCYLENRSPHTRLDGRIPEEIWSGRKVELGHLRIFGCTAFVHGDPSQRSKLDARTRKMVFIGYPRGVKGYRLWDPLERKATISRDVVFNEYSVLRKQKEVEEQRKIQPGAAGQQLTSYSLVSFAGAPGGLGVRVEHPSEVSPCVDIQVEHPSEVPPRVESSETRAHGRDERREDPHPSTRVGVALHKPKRIVRQPERDGFGETMSYALVAVRGDPETYAEAVTSQISDRRVQAMAEEMQSLHKNRTWRLVSLPSGRNSLGADECFDARKWLQRRWTADTWPGWWPKSTPRRKASTTLRLSYRWFDIPPLGYCRAL